MNRQIFKVIIGGALIGAALFWMPFFVFKVAVFFTILGTFFWFARRRRRGHYSWSFADRIRAMNDEEYEEFKNNVANRRCNYSDRKEGEDEKK